MVCGQIIHCVSDVASDLVNRTEIFAKNLHPVATSTKIGHKVYDYNMGQSARLKICYIINSN